MTGLSEKLLPTNGILKPGSITDAEYRALPHMNISLLKKGLPALAKLKHAIDEPDAEASKAMNLGSLLHAMVLQPHEVKNLFAFAPTVDGRTKEGKAAKAEFEKTAVGKIVVSEEDKITASKMAASILQWATDPANIEPASTILCPNAITETAMVWLEEDWANKQPCKGKLDRLCPNGTDYISGPVILDIKTTKDASPAEWDRTVQNYKYHMQAAWYRRGYEIITGVKPRFIFLAVESEAPHLCAAYELTPEALAIGDELCARLLEKYERAAKTGHWPGYPTGLNVSSLPTWALIRHSEDPANAASWGNA